MMKNTYLKITLVFFTIFAAKAYLPLSNETIKIIPGPGHDFDVKSGEILAPILIPRVSGTDGSTIVQRHFVNWFTKHLPKWKIEFRNSTSTTPISRGKEITFVNIIITRDPPWAKQGDIGRLVLAAHYDSKYSPSGFIGATDSAAPCAMIMHAARNIDEALTRKWAPSAEGFQGLAEHRGVQIILIDGEEAFLSWTDTDSLYGSRSLAEFWDINPNPPMSIYHNPLDSITLLVLLDLLGSQGTTIPSYFETTHWAYKHLARIETRMRSLGQMRSPDTTVIFPDSNKSDFMHGSMIQDDHIPFMTRGVEILHLIPSRFPSVWHTMEDSGENLDMLVTEDWAKIISIFVSEWMELEGHFSDQI